MTAKFYEAAKMIWYDVVGTRLRGLVKDIVPDFSPSSSDDDNDNDNDRLENFPHCMMSVLP